MRQQEQQRFACSSLTCSVAVKTEHKIRHLSKKSAQMFVCSRGTKRCDRKSDAELRQRDDIKIALNNDQPGQPIGCTSRFIKTIQFAPFMKKRRFGRIQILRFCIAQDSTTKSNGSASKVPYRKHNPISKAIVMTRFIFLSNEQSGL